MNNSGSLGLCGNCFNKHIIYQKERSAKCRPSQTFNVLCPGPSLANYERGPDPTITIGVNRATLHQPCDWWSVADFKAMVIVLNEYTRAPKGILRYPPPRKVFGSVMVERDFLNGRAGYTWPPTQWLGFADPHIPVPYEMQTQWRAWSSTAALVLAYELSHIHILGGNLTINVWGADMAGTGEFDGDSPDLRIKDGRKKSRWEKERVTWQGVTDWLARHNTTVIRQGCS